MCKQMCATLIRPHFSRREARSNLWVGCEVVAARGWGREEWRMTANEYEVLFGIMNVFWNYIMVVLAHLCEYAKNDLIVYFKRVNFILCKLYISF